MSTGLTVAHARSSDPPQIAHELSEQLGPTTPGLVLFFVSSKLAFADVAAAVAQAFPDSLTIGCTTCGEIGPDGFSVGQVSALALTGPMQARAVLLEQLAELKYERCVQAVDELRAGIGAERVRERPEDFVFLSLTDGLSGAEELLLAALASAAPKVPLVGGSAGDDFQFQATQVALGPRVSTGSAVLLLLEPQRPFVPFHLHHYTRVAAPIVVTEADPARRLVSRLDGYPAVPFLAKLAGLDEQRLRDDPLETLAARQIVFGFEVGPATFMRSVMTVQAESLLMGGSLEEGTLIYPMAAGDIVAATRDGLGRALAGIAEPQGLLLFNCAGRMLEAGARGLVAQLGAAMLPIPGAGFTTYGEQFGAVQINHTLTGLVLGQAT
ncbi:FIST signal transduction protein [Enhygromyxa salina]|uniref:FIST N domain protein n=1 Tax=Enhygromyxa salina TaxID=215803 RepID=A0A2S9YPT4_9BACT|nr:FIST N-terminal domain-containing protein [Enhygromyxa salina]PRQ07097.1 FIST N domain protein [Enhygromyxa salina]